MTMIGTVYTHLFEKINMVHIHFIDSSNNEGDEVDLVREDVGAELEATGTYVCMATNAVDSARQTVQVRVIGMCNINIVRTYTMIYFPLLQLPVVLDQEYI